MKENVTMDIFTAAERLGAKRNQSVDEFLATAAKAIEQTSYPSPECLLPDEISFKTQHGAWPTAAQREIEAHLAKCVACRTLVAACAPGPDRQRQFVQLATTATARPVVEAPRVERKNAWSLRQFALVLMASSLLCLGVLVGAKSTSHRPPPVEVAVSPNSSLPTARVVAWSVKDSPSAEPLVVSTEPVYVAAKRDIVPLDLPTVASSAAALSQTAFRPINGSAQNNSVDSACRADAVRYVASAINGTSSSDHRAFLLDLALRSPVVIGKTEVSYSAETARLSFRCRSSRTPELLASADGPALFAKAVALRLSYGHDRHGISAQALVDLTESGEQPIVFLEPMPIATSKR